MGLWTVRVQAGKLVRVRGDSGLHQDSTSGHWREVDDLGFILEIVPVGLINALNVGVKKKREIFN